MEKRTENEAGDVQEIGLRPFEFMADSGPYKVSRLQPRFWEKVVAAWDCWIISP